MTQLSIGEAAALAGVHRTTILRQIKEGRLSATRSEKGSYQMDVAELQRVYPQLGVQREGDASSDAQQSIAAVQVDAMQRQIELMRQQIDALQQDKQWLMQQLEQVTQRLLPAPKRSLIDRLAEAWAKGRR